MRFLIVLAFVAMFALGCGNEAPTTAAVPMGPREAQSLMEQNKNHVIVDVRMPEEYEEMHIAKAVNIPLPVLEKNAPNALLDKNQLIFVYCRTGRRSRLAMDALGRLGYTNVIDLGGIVDWLGPVELPKEKEGGN